MIDVQTLAPIVHNNTPPIDSSNTEEHYFPVGFFTARAAKSIYMERAAFPLSVPTFDSYLESFSIHRTAEIDYKEQACANQDNRGKPSSGTTFFPPNPR